MSDDRNRLIKLIHGGARELRIEEGARREMMLRVANKSSCSDMTEAELDAVLGEKRSLGIELKAERGRLSDPQIETHEAITLAGGVVTTCRSLDDVAAFLATLGVPCRAGAPR